VLTRPYAFARRHHAVVDTVPASSFERLLRWCRKTPRASSGDLARARACRRRPTFTVSVEGFAASRTFDYLPVSVSILARGGTCFDATFCRRRRRSSKYWSSPRPAFAARTSEGAGERPCLRRRVRSGLGRDQVTGILSLGGLGSLRATRQVAVGGAWNLRRRPASRSPRTWACSMFRCFRIPSAARPTSTTR